MREIEQRIQHTEAQGHTAMELPTRPTDVPPTFDEHTKLMFDLVALAYRADITRVFTMIFSRELSTRTFPNIGVPEQHHPVSHHRNDPELIAKKAKIDVYHASLLGYFLEKLQARAGRRRLAAGSQPDHVRRRHGRRQSAPPLRSARAAGRQTRRKIQDRPASELSGKHADGEPAPDRARQGGRADGHDRRQQRAAAARLFCSCSGAVCNAV